MSDGGLGPFTLSESELAAWGERIGSSAAVPLVLALRGQLGAGKSVLARAVARGAGVAGHMPSPTFNLLYRYRASRGIDVVHLDLYRLEDAAEVWELGWAELGDGAEIVLVEWPERAEALLPADRWDVWLVIPQEEATTRAVRAERRGEAPDLPGPTAFAGAGGPTGAAGKVETGGPLGDGRWAGRAR